METSNVSTPPSKADVYRDNLANFVLSLPKSKLRFLFFNCDSNAECKPCLNIRVRAWNNPSLTSTPVYISPSSNANCIYLYRENQIKYKVEIDRQTQQVIAFEPITTSYAPVQNGGAFLTAHWGEHLTVMIKRTRHHLLLKNHLTRYEIDVENKTKTSYIREAIYCDIDLEKPIDSNSKCIQSGLVTSLTLDMYNQLPRPDPHIVSLLQELTKVIKSNSKIYSAGSIHNVEYTTFKGRRHRLYQGSKGGRYVLSKGEKVYIKQIGGNDNPSMMYQEEGFNELFMNFIKETRIDPVAAIQVSRVRAREKGALYLSDVQVIDDEDSTYMMILYHHNVADDLTADAKIFAIEKKIMLAAFDVYKIPVAERTFEQQATYDAFASHYEPIPVRMIDVAA
jgi:hypothetical protein